MANVTFYYEGVEDATFTINTMTSDADFPLNNLNDRCKDLYWKEGTGNTSGYIEITLPTTHTQEVDHLILINHNYSDTGKGIKLTYCEDDDGNFTPESYALGSAGAYHDYTASDATNWFESFTAEESRYWRLYLEAMGAATYQQIGTIILGTAFEHTVNWNFAGGKRGHIYGVDQRVTVGGTKRTQKNHDRRRTWDYEFQWINETHHDNIVSFLETVYGNYLPFGFKDEDGTLFYGRLANPGVEFDHLRYQFYGIPMRIEEEI